MMKILIEHKPEMVDAKNSLGKTPLAYVLRNDGKFSTTRNFFFFDFNYFVYLTVQSRC